jgi:hypothetical protein
MTSQPMHEYQTKNLLSELLKYDPLDEQALTNVKNQLVQIFRSPKSLNMGLIWQISKHISHLKRQGSNNFDSLKIMSLEKKINQGLANMVSKLELEQVNQVDKFVGNKYGG